MSGGIRKGAGRKASPIDLIAPETDESIAKGRRAGLSVVPRRSGAASDISTSTPAALLSAKQQEAIEALLLHGTVEDAARETFITIKKLSLWMKNPAFMAAYLAAKRAEHRQSLACLAQGPLNIVRSLLQIMYHGKKPATRLKAARKVISMAGEGIELEEFAVAVAYAEGLVKAAQTRGQPAGAAGKARTAGHGAKLPRRMEQAITALLGQPSVAEAARTIGVKPATLRLWMENPAFIARYAEAAWAVFGPAMRLAQHRRAAAVGIIKNLSTDPAVPEETRLKAVIYRADAVQANVITNLESRVSGMEPAGADTGEAQVTSQLIGSSLHERLKQIKSRLLHASGQSAVRRIILVHAADGRAAGSSVAGPDGRRRWFDPPEGFKKDDLVKDDSIAEGPLEDTSPLQEKAA